MDAERAPSFPPLFRGEALRAGLDPFAKAVSRAMLDDDPGRLVWSEDPDRIAAAAILAPETPLEEAMAAVFAAALGFGDSLGALAPPEVAVHFVWPDRIKVNGARCGRIRAAAATADPAASPDWLVVGFEIPMRREGGEPGESPDETTLIEEGCGLIPAPRLIESWSRHMLVWINRLMDDGMAPLHADWRARCDELGERVTTPAPGVFVGLDERGAMLLKTETGTRAIPLSTMLEARA